MTVVRTRTRALAAASAVALLLGLAACGGGGDDNDNKGSAGLPTQDPNVTFTGDPVTVMTMSTYDTDSLNAKAVLDVAQAAVVQINNDGGLGGHELKLITCNDSGDPNKAADCARQAVDEGVAAMVGGFTANGDAIMPILDEAGIPWYAPPGISSAELSSEDSYPITSGVLGLAGLGQMAAEDGCDKVASINFDLPSSGSIAQLGSTTNYYVVPVGLSDTVSENGGAAVEGTKSLSNFPDLDDPIWDDAKKYTGGLEDEENGGLSGLYFQNTWVAYRTFLSLIKNNDDFSAAAVKATLDATTQVDTDGFTPPFSFAEDFPAPGLNRVFNYSELTFEIKDGELQQDGDEYTDMRLALVPAS